MPIEIRPGFPLERHLESAILEPPSNVEVVVNSVEMVKKSARETPPQFCHDAFCNTIFHGDILTMQISSGTAALLGICFLRGAPEDVVVEIGEGEKGGW